MELSSALIWARLNNGKFNIKFTPAKAVMKLVSVLFSSGEVKAQRIWLIVQLQRVQMIYYCWKKGCQGVNAFQTDCSLLNQSAIICPITQVATSFPLFLSCSNFHSSSWHFMFSNIIIEMSLLSLIGWYKLISFLWKRQSSVVLNTTRCKYKGFVWSNLTEARSLAIISGWK